MSDVKTSENFHAQDEYHRAYFHKIDEPAPLKADRVDPNLPADAKVEVVDPDEPGAPTKRAKDEGKASREPENKTELKARSTPRSSK